jgi:uncharacterized membrane protein
MSRGELSVMALEDGWLAWSLLCKVHMSLTGRMSIVALWDRMRGSLWFVPSTMMTVAATLAFGMLWIDHRYSLDGAAEPFSWLYGGSPEGAREVLSSVASATITIAGVVFSITVVALTLASQQFGPRVLRNFMRDVGTQIVLGTFISIHLYCLIVLRSVRTPSSGGFVPHGSVALAITLAVTAAGVLVYFFHHLTASLRVSHIIREISADFECAIDRLYPDEAERGGLAAAEHSCEAWHRSWGRTPISLGKSGYLLTVQTEALLAYAKQHDLVVALNCRPGDFIAARRIVAHLFARHPVNEDIVPQVKELFLLGDERTVVQDVAFPAQQLTEIALRALSPSTNDPATALACIDRLMAAFIRLAHRRCPSPYLYDDTGEMRVIAEPVPLSQIVNDTFGQIREYGRTSSAVTTGLLDAIVAIAPHVTTEDERQALARQARWILEAGEEGLPMERDRMSVRERYSAAYTALYVNKAA